MVHLRDAGWMVTATPLWVVPCKRRSFSGGSDWRMADVIWVDGGARNPKVPTLFHVADVDTGVINWVNADLATHIVPMT